MIFKWQFTSIIAGRGEGLEVLQRAESDSKLPSIDVWT
jgi:hypothetical protein